MIYKRVPGLRSEFEPPNDVFLVSSDGFGYFGEGDVVLYHPGLSVIEELLAFGGITGDTKDLLAAIFVSASVDGSLAKFGNVRGFGFWASDIFKEVPAEKVDLSLYFPFAEVVVILAIVDELS